MNKYRARHVKDDGITFDSKSEHKRYGQLKLMQKARLIEGLEVHPKFKAVINEQPICTIELDFRYFDKTNNRMIYEDVKGVDTPMSKMKRKILKALFPEVDLYILTAK